MNMHLFGDRQNPALLLLHGIGIGHRLWLRQIEQFQQSHFILAPDMPGLTASTEDSSADIPEIAKRLEAAIRDQGIDAIFSVRYFRRGERCPRIGTAQRLANAPSRFVCAASVRPKDRVAPTNRYQLDTAGKRSRGGNESHA